MKKYWLLKSEPDTFGIDDLKKKKREPWTGVRNYQARNFMKEMKVGDLCFFYHSSCEIPGISGLCKVTRVNQVDETQFDPRSEYFDSKSKKENPTWVCVEVGFVKKFKNLISLTELRKEKKLSKMTLLQKGSRLSVQPVKEEEYVFITKTFKI